MLFLTRHLSGKYFLNVLRRITTILLLNFVYFDLETNIHFYQNKNSRWALAAEIEEELKSLLMKVKEESDKAGLKLNIQKTKIMVSGPITSWQIDGETMEIATDFTFLGSKITADGDCSHEIKRRLLLGRKAMTNLNRILKSRDITLLTNVGLVKAGFSSSHVRMWESDHTDSWAPKNWCFWTVVFNPKRNQYWTFTGKTNAEAEAPILWPPDAKKWLTGKDPDAGKDWRQQEEGKTEDEMAGSPTRWTWVWASSGSWWWTGRPGVLQSMGSQRVGHIDWATEVNWTELTCLGSLA